MSQRRRRPAGAANEAELRGNPRHLIAPQATPLTHRAMSQMTKRTYKRDQISAARRSLDVLNFPRQRIRMFQRRNHPLPSFRLVEPGRDVLFPAIISVDIDAGRAKSMR